MLTVANGPMPQAELPVAELPGATINVARWEVHHRL